MLPQQLSGDSFREFPAEARRVAAENIDNLRRLPLAFAPLLLKELIQYDWKFPAERRDLDRQFAYLRSLNPAQFSEAMAPFAKLRLKPELERTDWVNSPAAFSEEMSAHLWATHQIDTFRSAAVDYVAKSSVFQPDPPPPARLAIALIGRGVTRTDYHLFRKLRPRGVYYSNVRPEGGLETILRHVSMRAEQHQQPYAHWFIDGESTPAPPVLTPVSYSNLAPVRAKLQATMQRTYEASKFDPEAFRSLLARTRPEDVGLSEGDAVLNRFSLSLFSEGSGTQVFATTFVQWAAREALRRAQPLTLVARFTPRQREKPMNELLAETRRMPELDPEGSLIDSDMGAYYVWLDQQRLSGASAFLAWFEDHQQAVAIAPQLKPGTTDDNAVSMDQLLATLTT